MVSIKGWCRGPMRTVAVPLPFAVDTLEETISCDISIVSFFSHRLRVMSVMHVLRVTVQYASLHFSCCRRPYRLVSKFTFQPFSRCCWAL